MCQYVARPNRECKNQLIVGANGGCPNFQGPKSLNGGMVRCIDKPDVSLECLNIGSLPKKLKLGLTPALQQMGYGEHCESPVGYGAKPQPKSVLVNFRTKNEALVQFLICHSYMLKNFTKFSIEGGTACLQ